jgi:hypothetical protein
MYVVHVVRKYCGLWWKNWSQDIRGLTTFWTPLNMDKKKSFLVCSLALCVSVCMYGCAERESMCSVFAQILSFIFNNYCFVTISYQKICMGLIKLKKVKPSCNGLWRPMRLWDVEAPTFSRQSAHRWRWGCHPHVLAAFYPQKDSLYLILLEVELTPGPYCSWKD